MSHDPFAGPSRRNAKRRPTTPRPAPAVPGDAAELLAWINEATDPDERRQRANLVIQTERQTAAPRRAVITAAKAAAKSADPLSVPGAKRRAAHAERQPQPADTTSDASEEHPPPPAPPPPPPPPADPVPEGARKIVAWIRDASGPDEARHRAEAARVAETERNGTIRPTVQAAIDQAL